MTRGLRAVKHGDDPQRTFVRRVRDQILANQVEAQRREGHITAARADVRGRADRAENVEDVGNHAVGGRRGQISELLRHFRRHMSHQLGQSRNAR
jgi:hypothetical protein